MLIWNQQSSVQIWHPPSIKWKSILAVEIVPRFQTTLVTALKRPNTGDTSDGIIGVPSSTGLRMPDFESGGGSSTLPGTISVKTDKKHPWRSWWRSGLLIRWSKVRVLQGASRKGNGANMTMTQSNAGKLGWIASKKYRDQKYKKIRDDYESNPKKCNFCGKILDWNHRRRKHCNLSCSSKSRVRKRRRIKTVHNTCPQCGKPTLYNKWCSKECQSIYIFRQNRELGQPLGKTAIRKYLLLTRDYVCEQCGNHEWINENRIYVPITLEVHHIDGNHNNNEERNLKLICPNCHSITDNYKSKNNGKGRDNRRKIQIIKNVPLEP